MGNKVCIIEFSRGVLDNDYHIYDDGRIEHLYDKSYFDHSYTTWLTVEDLGEEFKQKLLRKCPKEHIETVRGILYPDS
jgi:hypothetical protein